MLYDISQPVFECDTYPGDPSPARKILSAIESGDMYDLTEFSMCAHNGTHVDAPRHFIKDGKGIGEIELEKFIGRACVISCEGDISAEDARRILSIAGASSEEAGRHILIKGEATIGIEAAEVFAEAGIDLLGSESQSVGPEDEPAAVHTILLEAEVVLLEGIRLENVTDGEYFLNCAPLNLGDAEGAPCRAILADL